MVAGGDGGYIGGRWRFWLGGRDTGSEGPSLGRCYGRTVADCGNTGTRGCSCVAVGRTATREGGIAWDCGVIVAGFIVSASSIGWNRADVVGKLRVVANKLVVLKPETTIVMK